MRREHQAWAKTSPYPGVPERWHPLLLHLLDVAAVADVVLEREPATTRNRLAEVLGLRWSDARPWLLLLIGCHDLGKASPSFQSRWMGSMVDVDLPWPRSRARSVSHGFITQVALSGLLTTAGWPRRLAELAADAVGCHHGERASQRNIEDAEIECDFGNQGLRNPWTELRESIYQSVKDGLPPTSATPNRHSLTGPDFMLLAGLTSFADWIGSNETWFPFGTPSDCDDPTGWYNSRRELASRALDAAGWLERTPLLNMAKTFNAVIGRDPRPLQIATVAATANAHAPPVILIEAPMGEGKTEAAFYGAPCGDQDASHPGRLHERIPERSPVQFSVPRTIPDVTQGMAQDGAAPGIISRQAISALMVRRRSARRSAEPWRPSVAGRSRSVRDDARCRKGSSTPWVMPAGWCRRTRVLRSSARLGGPATATLSLRALFRHSQSWLPFNPQRILAPAIA